MTTIVVFGSALFILLVLLLMKKRELKTGTENSILKFLSRLDGRVVALQNKLQFRGEQVRQSAEYIVKIRMRQVAQQAYETSRESLEKRRGMMMGKKDLSNRGSASFFLKKIIEEKESAEKGVIVDHDLPEEDDGQ